MRRGFHCLGLLLVVALVLPTPLARAQLDALGYKHAFVDEKTGKRTMLLSGDSVTNIASELLLRDGVRLQFFDDAGKTNFDVTSRQCVYNTETKLVWSGEKLMAGSPDGQFSLEGRGFQYQIVTGSLVVSNEVHAILRKELLEPQSGPSPAGGDVPAQPTATPASAQLLHIFSDRMRYQSNLAVFEDNVRVEDPQGQVTCGVLTVAFSASSQPEERRRVENILAEQRVVIDSDEVHATGDQATYRLTTDVASPAVRRPRGGTGGEPQDTRISRRTQSGDDTPAGFDRAERLFAAGKSAHNERGPEKRRAGGSAGGGF